MTSPSNLTESEMGAWLFRIGMGVIGFFLCLGVKDAKKSIDQVPKLVASVEEMQRAQEMLFRRVDELERGRKR